MLMLSTLITAVLTVVMIPTAIGSHHYEVIPSYHCGDCKITAVITIVIAT